MRVLARLRSQLLVNLKYIQQQAYALSIRRNYFNNKMQGRYTNDHSIELELCGDVEKDLRISYLEQYESNAYGDVGIGMSRQRSRFTLKDITDKYGFYWDDNGRLMKKQMNQRSIDKKQTRNNNLGTGSMGQNRPTNPSRVAGVNKMNKNPETQLDKRIKSIVGKYDYKQKENTSEMYCQCRKVESTAKEAYRIEMPAAINYDEILKQDKPIKSRSCRRIDKIQQKTELDEKIEEITAKIKACQRQKKQLNIQYQQFESRPVSRSKSSKNLSRPKVQETAKKQATPQQPQMTYKPIQNLPNQLRFTKNTTLQTPKFVQALCLQIQLDQQLRISKLWFESNPDPHKWGILADKLEAEGVNYTYFQLLDLFSCREEEHNPFFSAKKDHESYSSLVTYFRQSENHWKTQLVARFSTEQLAAQEFTQNGLDIERKGYVRIEDLVRYINMRTKNFYRSRDLVQIFHRLAGKDKKEVNFSQIVQSLVK